MAFIIGQTCWQFIAGKALGSEMFGGNLMCRDGNGNAIIVAPDSTAVNAGWSNTTAITCAEANAPCGDWFLPTLDQLCDPILCHKTNIPDCSGVWWSTTCCGGFSFDNPATGPQFLVLTSGFNGSCYATDTYKHRAFRCITY